MSENNLIFMFATNGAPDKSTHKRKELEMLLLPLELSDNFDQMVLKCFQEIFFEKDTRIAARPCLSTRQLLRFWDHKSLTNIRI